MPDASGLVRRSAPHAYRWRDRRAFSVDASTTIEEHAFVAMSVSVLLVDDHEVVRQGMRALLGGASDLSLVGEAATADEALRALDLG